MDYQFWKYEYLDFAVKCGGIFYPRAYYSTKTFGPNFEVLKRMVAEGLLTPFDPEPGEVKFTRFGHTFDVSERCYRLNEAAAFPLG